MAVATVLKNWDMNSWNDGAPRMSEADANLGRKDYPVSNEPLTDRSCVRCAHYRRGEMDAAGMHLCERPQLGVTHDYVVGEDVPNKRDAYRERAYNIAQGFGEESCGPEGKFWTQSGF